MRQEGPDAPRLGLFSAISRFADFPGNLFGPAASSASTTRYRIEPDHHAPDPRPARCSRRYRRRRPGPARARPRGSGGARDHAGQQSQALPAGPRHFAQRQRSRGRGPGNLCPPLRIWTSSAAIPAFRLALPHRHERALAGLRRRRRASSWARCRKRARSPNHPVFVIGRSGKSMAQRESSMSSNTRRRLPEAFRLVFITRVIGA